MDDLDNIVFDLIHRNRDELKSCPDWWSKHQMFKILLEYEVEDIDPDDMAEAMDILEAEMTDYDSGEDVIG